ncbi:hypothetical protein NKH77_19045 [Streptomyces sp. M19]
MLTFVDNRQDASLQSGHFNDFVMVTQLRGALYRAMVAAGDKGLRWKRLGEDVVAAMGLSRTSTRPSPPRSRSWPRARWRHWPPLPSTASSSTWNAAGASPCPTWNRPGCSVWSTGLDAIAGDEDRWRDTVGPLRTATPEARHRLSKVLMDELRRQRAVDTPYFTEAKFAELRKESARLNDAWGSQTRRRRRLRPSSPWPGPAAPAAPGAAAAS